MPDTPSITPRSGPTRPLRHKHVRGFALLVTITLLAFLVLLLVTMGTLTRVETQVATNSQSLGQARQNAIFALNIAIGQLQKYAGPDQRITAPATTVFPSKDATKATGLLYDDPTYGYRSKAQTSSARSYLTKVETYLTPTERTSWNTELQTYWNANRNPRYVGVFDSSLRVNQAGNLNVTPTALARQQYGDANNNGTFGEGTDYATTFGEFKRDQIPVWLVSGVENYHIDQSAGTVKDAAGADKLNEYKATYGPDAILPDPTTDSNYLWLVNTKSATLSADSSDGLDGRVKVKKQEIKGPSVISTTNETIGHYAYWVGDESIKANVAVQDPYNSSVQGTVEYRNRLQVPQRLGWERITGFDASSINPYSTDFLKVVTPAQIPFIDSTLADNPSGARGPIPRNFHNLTAFSRSLFTDTALGGLKKDLTVYLDTGAGLNGTDPIPNPASYTANDPRFKAWDGGNTGFPLSSAGIPVWSQIKNWYDNASSGGGAVNVSRDAAPIISYVNMHHGFSYDPATKQIIMHWIPAIVLWNPYDVPLNTASYDVDIGNAPAFYNFLVASPGVRATDVTLTDIAPPIGTPDNPGTEGTFRDNMIPVGPNTADFYYPLDPVATDWNNKSHNVTDVVFSHYNSDDKIYSGAIGTSTGSLARAWNPMQDKLTSNDVVTQPKTITSSSLIAVDQTMKFRITDSLGAGESKIYTLGDSNAGDDVPNWPPATRLRLKNLYVVDTPASASFPVMKITANAPVADAAQPNGLNRILKWSSSCSGSSYATPYMRLALAGDPTPLSETFATGYVQFDHYQSAFSRSPDNLAVNSWKRVIPATDRLLDFFTPADTKTVEGSIWRAFRVWLSPIMSDGGATTTQVEFYYPAFSRFNIGRNMDPHPQVEAIRNRFHVNNTDWFSSYYTYLGKPNSSPSFPEPAWDEGQSVDGKEAYSLISFQNKPGNTYTAQTLLPVRNAKRAQANILSLGQLQQVNLSPYAWEPSFPIGNSDASPYTDREAIAGIHSRSVGGSNFSGGAIGLIDNTGVTTNRLGAPVGGNSMLDLSYLLNETLWDSYFLSSLPQSGSFATYDPATGITGTSASPIPSTLLPDSRIKIADASGLAAADMRDFDTASAHLYNVGALNVNSTSVEAWKALIMGFRNLKLGDNPNNTVPISRTLDPIGGSIAFTDTTQDAADIGATATAKDYTKVLNGFRYLNDTMVQTLAERIVDEVRLRGPFMSLADFVNRRLVAPSGSKNTNSPWYDARTNGNIGPSNDNHNDYIDPSYDPFIGLQGINGALQRAINVSGINGGVDYPATSANLNDRVYSIILRKSGDSDNASSPSSAFVVTPGTSSNKSRHTFDPTMRSHLDTEHWAGAPAGEAGQTFQGTAGFVTQGDLLAMIGSALTPRGDTFLVRTYGDAVNLATGELKGRAWLEAVVQRTADPVTPAGATGAAKYQPTDAFGRKFKVISFRWLSESEL